MLDTVGAPSSETLMGPPEITTPDGDALRILSMGASHGRISLCTFSSLILLAMSCVNWEPQSSMTMLFTSPFLLK